MQFRLIITDADNVTTVSAESWVRACEIRREAYNQGCEVKTLVRRREEGFFRPPLFSDRLF